MDKAPELGFGGTGYDDNLIEMGFGGSFKQKRYVYGQPGIARLVASGGCEVKPGAAYGGMKDCLEGFSLYRVGENNGAKGGTLQDPRVIENTGAKFFTNRAKDGCVSGGQLPGTGIRVEDSHRGEETGETFCEECLACGYPARDTQNWHAE
jgi:hypothetical protein